MKQTVMFGEDGSKHIELSISCYDYVHLFDEAQRKYRDYVFIPEIDEWLRINVKGAVKHKRRPYSSALYSLWFSDERDAVLFMTFFG